MFDQRWTFEWNPYMYMLPWIDHHANRPTVVQFLWIASETPVRALHELAARLALAVVSLVFFCFGWLMWVLLGVLFTIAMICYYYCLLLVAILAEIGWWVVDSCSNYKPAGGIDLPDGEPGDHDFTFNRSGLWMAAWPFLLLGVCLCGAAALVGRLRAEGKESGRLGRQAGMYSCFSCGKGFVSDRSRRQHEADTGHSGSVLGGEEIRAAAGMGAGGGGSGSRPCSAHTSWNLSCEYCNGGVR